MNDKSRKERRDEQRATRKDFASVAKDIEAALPTCKDPELREAVTQGYKELCKSDAPTKLISGQMLLAAIGLANEEHCAEAAILLFLGGVILEPSMTDHYLNCLMREHHGLRLSAQMPQDRPEPPGPVRDALEAAKTEAIAQESSADGHAKTDALIQEVVDAVQAPMKELAKQAQTC